MEKIISLSSKISKEELFALEHEIKNMFRAKKTDVNIKAKYPEREIYASRNLTSEEQTSIIKLIQRRNIQVERFYEAA